MPPLPRLPPSPSMHELINSPLHRIPTLWSLYRPLLRLSSVQIHPAIESGVLRAYVKREFRRSTKLTGRDKIRDKLRKGYELLDLLETRSTSPTSSARLHSLIKHISLSRPHKTLTPPPPPLKPRLTRGILQAQPYHPPLPRLKPQPWRLGAMIHERRKRIAKRWLQSEQVKIWSEDGRDEDRFERDVLQGGEGKGRVNGNGEEQVWAKEWSELWERWKVKARRESKMNEMKTPKEMQDRATRVAKISGRARAGYGTIDSRRTGEDSTSLGIRKNQGQGGG